MKNLQAGKRTDKWERQTGRQDWQADRQVRTAKTDNEEPKRRQEHRTDRQTDRTGKAGRRATANSTSKQPDMKAGGQTQDWQPDKCIKTNAKTNKGKRDKGTSNQSNLPDIFTEI